MQAIKLPCQAGGYTFCLAQWFRKNPQRIHVSKIALPGWRLYIQPGIILSEESLGHTCPQKFGARLEAIHPAWHNGFRRILRAYISPKVLCQAGGYTSSLAQQYL